MKTEKNFKNPNTEKFTELLIELGYYAHCESDFDYPDFVGFSMETPKGKQEGKLWVEKDDTIKEFAEKVASHPFVDPELQSLLEKEWRWFSNHQTPNHLKIVGSPRSYWWMWEKQPEGLPPLLYAHHTDWPFFDGEEVYSEEVLEVRCDENYPDIYVVFDGEFIWGGIPGLGDFPERFRYLKRGDLWMSDLSKEGAKLFVEQATACFTAYEFYYKKYVKKEEAI